MTEGMGSMKGYYDRLPPLILASGSPRRAQLLEAMGVGFRVAVSGADERGLTAGLEGEAVACRLSLCKARAVLQADSQAAAGRAMVLGADTVVLCDGQRLDKPLSRAEAVEGLARLAGRWHEVVTGIALLCAAGEWTLHEVTRVHFAALSAADIAHYVDGGSPYDKAGGYGIQEWIGCVGIDRIEGSYENVMGLPTQRLHALFQDIMQGFPPRIPRQ